MVAYICATASIAWLPASTQPERHARACGDRLAVAAAAASASEREVAAGSLARATCCAATPPLCARVQKEQARQAYSEVYKKWFLMQKNGHTAFYQNTVEKAGKPDWGQIQQTFEKQAPSVSTASACT